MNKNPLKKQQTKEKIFQAFFREYKQKPLRKITVSAIADNACINRCTFYEYFKDVYDLLEQAQETLIHEILACLDQIKEQDNPHKFELFSAFGQNILYKYGEQMAVLLSHGDTGFQKKLLNAMKPFLLEMLGIDDNDIKTNLVISYALFGTTGYITTLYGSDTSITNQEAVRTLQKLMVTSLSQLPDASLPIYLYAK
ncbi:TetR/AcrR family transcriptional regulator [Clostridium sp. AF19-22AC]|jgi:AcrR family transcriptional regulator|uniref:TetR/AcrR family transcriptional regulator n=1 Tax=Clostridia TaxID=186801 RepID=UPI000E4CC9C0|nr:MULTISPECIES: TetR/AcrR family transcriptional regulator [Clostridia]RHR31190.1 TetR/AcrR family transcriptional regulator [Clostridium sp. AF19-22AC]